MIMMTTTTEEEMNEIPLSIWHLVNSKLEHYKQQQHDKNKNKKRQNGVLIRKFTFNIVREAWGVGCGYVEEHNLFFESCRGVLQMQQLQQQQQQLQQQQQQQKKNKQKKNQTINNKKENITEELHQNHGPTFNENDYISVQFSERTADWNANNNNNTTTSTAPSNLYSYQLDEIREIMLRRGIKSPCGDTYHLLGCSNSQIKNYSYLFRKANHVAQNDDFLTNILPGMYDLQNKKGVAKRVKYVGLLFSGVRSFVDLPSDTIVNEIQTVEKNGYDFTDGPGLISIKLARLIQSQMNLLNLPSVFQIRYGGEIKMMMKEKKKGEKNGPTTTITTESFVCKGVLLVDPTEEDKYVLSFRKSMLKIKLARHNNHYWPTTHMNQKLGIVDYSQKKIGKLNQQLVTLLSANVPKQDFYDIQNFHLDRVKQCWHDPFSLGYLMSMEQNVNKVWDQYEQVLMHGAHVNVIGKDKVPSNYVSLSQKRNRYCNELGKLQIHIGNSRSLFGAVFPEELHTFLTDGQCLVFTEQGLLVDTVIVSRSPSYSTGDVRVLEAVDLPVDSPLRQLRNCILFATQGFRPEADKMSGGDMDGDLYLVIWDKRLTKYASKLRLEQPADYDEPPPKSKSISNKPKEDWIAYAAHLDNCMLGIVDRAFNMTAKEKGIKSEESKMLNKIFSSLVDKNPASIQILENLMSSIYLQAQPLDSNTSPCVWEEMLQRQMECAKDIWNSKLLPTIEDYSTFRDSLCAGPTCLFDIMKLHSDHFMVCVGPKRFSFTLKKLEMIKREQTPIDNGQILKAQITRDPGEVEDSLKEEKVNTMVTKCFSDMEKKAKQVFELSLKEHEEKRQQLLDDLKREHERRRLQFEPYEKKQNLLYKEIEIAKNKLEQIIKRIDELRLDLDCRLKFEESEKSLAELKEKEQRVQEKVSSLQKKNDDNMKEIESIDEQLKALPTRSFFYSFIFSNPEQDRLNKIKIQLENDVLEATSQLTKLSEKEAYITARAYAKSHKLHVAREHLNKQKYNQLSLIDLRLELKSAEKKEIQIRGVIRKKEGDLQEINEYISSVDGMIDEATFELNELETKQSFKKSELEIIASSCENFTSKIDHLTEMMLLVKQSLEKIKSSASAARALEENFKVFMESHDEITNYFDDQMLSESSYASLRHTALRYNDGTSPWSSTLKDIFGPEPKRQGATYERNEDRETLRRLFCCANKARQHIKDEHMKRNNNITTKMPDLDTEIANLENMLKKTGDEKKKSEVEIACIRKEIKSLKSKIKRRKRNNKGQQETITEIDDLLVQKEALSKRISELQDKQKMLTGEIKQFESTLNDKQSEKSELEKDFARFSRFYKDFEAKAGKSLCGELVETIPKSAFLQLKELVHTFDLPDLQERCQFLEKREQECGKKNYISDADIFTGYNSFLHDIQQHCSLDNIQNIDDEFYKLENDLRSYDASMELLEREREIAEQKKYKVAEEINDLEELIAPQRKSIEEMFSPERLHKLEEELQDTTYEESMHIAMKHVEHVLGSTRQEWTYNLLQNKSIKCVKSGLLKVTKEIQRVCDIEENRLLGFPRKGERKGRMPVYEKRAELQQALSSSDVVIVIAGTGCGKSTQLPQYIADDFCSHTKRPVNSKRSFARICCTQPRRLAAQCVAKRVAEEYITSLGGQVGFRVGMRGSNIAESQKISNQTRIEFVTEGWLLARLAKSLAILDNYDCVILDEAHERNIETDLLLALLKRHLQEDSTSMKLVVMSATIDPAQFCRYFGGCPVVDCPGKIFPVKEYYSPHYPSDSNGAMVVQLAVDVLFNQIISEFGLCTNYEEGDVLIFLSGSAQITLCVDQINSRAVKNKMPYIVAYPLYSQMNENEKDAATDPQHRTGLDNTTDGKHEYSRKVICSTNIAETSLTIDGIRFVVEGGYAKKLSYDHDIRSRALKEERISAASAKQRRGRAGRTAPGRCYYLYSKETHENMKPFETPQIMEKPVEELILFSLRVCGRSIEHLGILDCPEEADIDVAKERLFDLNLIENQDDADEVTLTEDGNLACKLSVISPQALRMIITARDRPELNCLHRAIKLGTIMSSEDDIFFRRNKDDEDNEANPFIHDLGDHFLTLTCFEKFELLKKKSKKGKEKALRQWCKESGIIFHVLNRIQSTVENIYKEMKRNNLLATIVPQTLDTDADDRLLKACISGYFSHAAQLVGIREEKIDFFQLEPIVDGGTKRSLQLVLGRESCLRDLLAEEAEVDEPDDGCILDELETSEKQIHEEALFNTSFTTFILYGNLLGIQTRFGRLVIINDASIINGRWIEDYAPKRWRDRIKFDADKPFFSRETIRNLGQPFLKCAFSYKQKNASELDVRVCWKQCKVVISGRTEKLIDAKQELKEAFEKERKKILRKDLARHRPNFGIVAFSQCATMTFGCGFILKGINSKVGDSPEQNIFGWHSLDSQAHIQARKVEEQRYWNVNKNNACKSKISIFVNRGDTKIFCNILMGLFPGEYYSFNVKHEKIEVTLLRSDLINWKESFIEHLSMNEDCFAPECVNSDSLSQNFSKKQYSLFHWKEIWSKLKAEWALGNPFWHILCRQIKAQFKGKVSVIFVPSRDRFEIFAQENIRAEARSALVESILNLCMPHNNQYHQPQLIKDVKWVKWDIIAKLEEIRLQYPTVRFSLLFGEVENQKGKSRCMDDENVVDFNLLLLTCKKSCFKSIGSTNSMGDSDFDRLESLMRRDNKLKDLLIVVQSTILDDLRAAVETLETNIPSKITGGTKAADSENKNEDGGGEKAEYSKCCMCRRLLAVMQNQRDESVAVSKKKSNMIAKKLTLCGCIFCRQCFLNSIHMKMKDYGKALCQRCSTPVLVKDCENIIKPKLSQQSKNYNLSLGFDAYEADWSRLSVISIANFCSDIEDIDVRKKCRTCPDCRTVVIHDTKRPFFYCRNTKCPNIMCSTCGKVPLSSDAVDTCKNQRCAAKDE